MVVRGALKVQPAVVDRPWSRGKLLSALGDSDDHGLTWWVRAVLLKCPDTEVRRAVAVWNECHRSARSNEDDDPRADDADAQSLMDEVRDRALAWRDRDPEDVAASA